MKDQTTTALDICLLDALQSQAQKSPRARMNHNLHEQLEDPCQRLLVAMEPRSYVPVHRHLTPSKAETFLVLRGRIALIVFDDRGTPEPALILAPDAGSFGAHIPAGRWHTVISLEPGSAFFECKEGPYQPIPEEDLAPWAPVPDDQQSCLDYLETLRALCS